MHFLADIREQMRLIERGVNQREMRYISRAVRCIRSLRKKTNDAILRKVTLAYYPASECLPRERERDRNESVIFLFLASPMKGQLLDFLEEVYILRLVLKNEKSMCVFLLADGNRGCIAVQATQFKDGTARYARTGHICPPPCPPQNAGQ